MVSFKVGHALVPADPVVGPGTMRAWPGLLVEWRQSASDWEARVVFLSRAGSQRWVVSEDWLPRHRLTPL